MEIIQQTLRFQIAKLYVANALFSRHLATIEPFKNLNTLEFLNDGGFFKGVYSPLSYCMSSDSDKAFSNHQLYLTYNVLENFTSFNEIGQVEKYTLLLGDPEECHKQGLIDEPTQKAAFNARMAIVDSLYTSYFYKTLAASLVSGGTLADSDGDVALFDCFYFDTAELDVVSDILSDKDITSHVTTMLTDPVFASYTQTLKMVLKYV